VIDVFATREKVAGIVGVVIVSVATNA